MRSIFNHFEIEEPPPRPLTPFEHVRAIMRQEKARRRSAYCLGRHYTPNALWRASVESVEHRLSQAQIEQLLSEID